ncbi:MAG: hypothetical protein N4A31_03920 [Rickettsiales bacterium]|jgi:hypothetical protein|nr:hypothetical protein [Rickettsiales bacterium]
MESSAIQTEESTISIFVPMVIKKRRGRGSVSIITPQNKTLPMEEKPSHDFRLINALAKAHRLQQKMEQDPEQTISSLAAKEGLTHAYVGRLLRLNLLAPDVVEAILEGRQPKGLKVIDFLRKEIPLLWEEQREKFGFSTL